MIKMTKNALKDWNKNIFGRLKQRKKLLEVVLKNAQENISLNNWDVEKKIKQELEKVEEQEQTMWMQKSRVNWILQGDRNTRFYHTVTTRRRIRNRIQGIWELG